MKILVVSLLRLGDVLLSTSVLRNLKRENPNAELHILINGQFASVAKLIPHVDKVYGFERDALQKIIGQPDHSLLEAYFRIEDLAEKLQGEKYDKVINLTHNRLSGWLTSLVGCADTQGVIYSEHGRLSVGSSWFTYLNNHTAPSQDNVYHFVDVFHYGAGLHSVDRLIELRESAAGLALADKVLANSKAKRRLVLQPSSHEAKKTFTPQKWRRILELIQKGDESLDIFVLGAPSEETQVTEICKDSDFKPFIAPLDGVFSLLNKSDILLTCDTSIKHLASATKIKVVEVSLGSSEFRKTGVYVSGALIIQGAVTCAPCPHRRPCSQKSHLCGDQVSEEAVALLSSALLRKDEVALRMLALEFREEAAIYRTHINIHGDWSAYPMAQPFSFNEIGRWVDRSSSKLWLEKAHEKKIGEFGSEGVELKRILENIFPDQSGKAWMTELKTLENRMDWLGEQIERYLEKLKTVLPHFDDQAVVDQFLFDLKNFCIEMTNNEAFRSYALELELTLKDFKAEMLPFHLVKKLRESLSVAHQRAKIEIKLIRGLQSDFMPKEEAL